MTGTQQSGSGGNRASATRGKTASSGTAEKVLEKGDPQALQEDDDESSDIEEKSNAAAP